MAEDLPEITHAVPITDASATATCCEATDAASVAPCVLCQKPICKNCRGIVNMKFVCASCRDQVVAELDAEKATPTRLPLAVAGGLVAAILCGALWAVMVVVTSMEIGFAAVGVGFVTGWGVLLGAGRKKGTNLQWIAVGCSVVGLILGKYFTIAHVIVTQVEGAKALSHFDPRLIQVCFQVLPETLSPWDLLWTAFALGAAWKVPKPTQIKVR